VGTSYGKAILLGEHAVVYDVPGIVVGLGKGATATAEAGEGIIKVDERVARANDGSELGRGYGAMLDAIGVRNANVTCSLHLPPGVGLGVSAAIAVAIARAVLPLAGETEPSLERVAEVAMVWERVFHGNPSGVDAWASAHGGCVLFKRSSGIKPIHVARPIPLAIGVAGPPASTKIMVDGVRVLRDKKPEMFNKTLAGIESLVRNAVLCIDAGDLIGLGKLLDLNQMLLSGLFLSTEEIESAIAWAREAGALGAKLTGSGGGGCVVALAEENVEPILEAWQKRGLQCFASTVPADEPRGTP
jgi:mevalonate kinase